MKYKELFNQLKEVGEMDVWIFVIQLNGNGQDILNFNKGYARYVPFQKVKAIIDDTARGIHDVEFRAYSKNGLNLLKKNIKFNKNGFSDLNIFTSQLDAELAYDKRRGEIAKDIEKYKEKLADFEQSLILE